MKIGLYTEIGSGRIKHIVSVIAFRNRRVNMKTAKLVKEINDSRSLYLLSEPLEGWDIVIVSAVNNQRAHETYIFPSNSKGEMVDFGELTGSIRGTTCHYTALLEAGYEIV